VAKFLKISRFLTPHSIRDTSADPGRPAEPRPLSETGRPRLVRTDEVFRVMAVCDPDPVEERLRTAARGLGQEVTFARSFPDALEATRERHHDIVIVAKIKNGMLARDFVREVQKINEEAVIVIAAPRAAYEELIEVMVEGAYDFLPQDADDRRLRLMLGRAMEYSQLRRRSGELERALDVQTASLRQRLQELAMLNEMSQDMSAVPDLDAVLRRALHRILEAFGSESGSFMILESETDELCVHAAQGPGAEELIGLKRKLGEGVSGKVARQRHPVLVTDVANDSRFKSDALSRAGADRYRSRSFVAVPLIHHGRLLGEMNITEKVSGEPFTQDDLRLLSILGGHVASAVNGALAAEELRRANESLTRTVDSTREDLRATNEKLTRAEGLAGAVVSALPAAVAAFDDALNITFANQAARDRLALEPGASLKGHPAWSDLARVANAAAEVIADGATKTLSTRGQLENCGSDGCLNIVVAPLRLADGTVAGGTILAMPGNCPLLRLDGE